MKKNLLLAGVLVAAVAVSVNIGVSKSYAEETVVQPVAEEILEDTEEVEDTKNDAKSYVSFKGVVEEVEKSEDNKSAFVLVKGEEDTIRFNISEEVLLLEAVEGEKINLDDIEEGLEVVAFYSKNTPMALSLPPQMTPEVFIVTPEESMEINVNYFDNELVANDESLKLNVSEETKVLDVDGKVVENAKLEDKKLLVFYGATTRSLPPQTNPILVYVLNDENAAVEEDGYVIIPEKNDFEYKKDGYNMLPLAQTAREYGYEARWNEEEKTVEIKNSVYSFKVTVDKAVVERVKDGETSKLNIPVTADRQNGTVYVPAEFFENFSGMGV